MPSSQDEGIMSEHVQVRAYHCLAEAHAASASYNAKRAQEIESDLIGEMAAEGGKTTGPKLIAHRADVMGAVIFAAAFVEAHINDVFGGLNDWASEQERNRLRAMWGDEDFRRKKSVLDKYKKAARVFNKTVNLGDAMPKKVIAILKLRDYYVHGKPDEITVESGQPAQATRPSTDDKQFLKELEEGLSSLPDLKGAIHPIFQGPANSWLNEKGVTAHLAQWAVNGCLDFADDFDTQKIGCRNAPRWRPTYGI